MDEGKYSAFPPGITPSKEFNKKHRKTPSIAKITYPKPPNRTFTLPKPSIPINAITQSLGEEILAVKKELKPIREEKKIQGIEVGKSQTFFDPVEELKRLTPVEKNTQVAIDDG